MTRGQLVALALGPDAVIDMAIPQLVFDSLPEGTRSDIAGWVYDERAPMYGRLLTQSECWRRIRAAIEDGRLMIVDPMKVGLTS